MTVLRVILGLILINHGYVKLFGDSAGVLAFFESTVLPMPGILLILSGVIEFFGGLMLVLGVFVRYTATIASIQWVVIILFVKINLGLAEMEFDLLILASLFTLSSLGGGALEMESIWKKKPTEEGSQHGGHGAEAMGG
jgi:putative oxidoreductase